MRDRRFVIPGIVGVAELAGSAKLIISGHFIGGMVALSAGAVLLSVLFLRERALGSGFRLVCLLVSLCAALLLTWGTLHAGLIGLFGATSRGHEVVAGFLLACTVLLLCAIGYILYGIFAVATGRYRRWVDRWVDRYRR